MKYSRIKHVQIKPKDFSDRRYFPGTPGHPYHIIDKIQALLVRVPFPIISFVLGGLVYLFSGDIQKSLLFAVFFLLDWILLRLLPVLRISFGPPTLTALTLAAMRSPFLLFEFPFALSFQALGSLLVIYGFYFEPRFPRVTHHKVILTQNIRESKTLKIVHISDLHMELFTLREDWAIERINALQPDIILYTGDFFNLSFQEHPESHADIQKFFHRLKAKHGIFGVTGSPSVDLESSLASILPGLNLTLLRDQILDLEVKGQPVQLIGLDCSHQPGKDIHRLRNIFQNIDPKEAKTRILLYHSPDLAPQLADLPIDLQVSGHTHGGQVQIPLLGPIYTGSLYGLAFSSGHYLVNESHHLVISRGLGLEGEAAPRVRFFSPPEINNISLEITGHHVK
jgi:uncharacterized protein